MVEQRLLLLFFIGSFTVFLQGACTQKEIPPQDTLTIALTAAPATLDPRRATDANGQRISDLIFNSLVRTGPNLEIIGDAAETWSYKDLVYTFKLRPDLRFSDGVAVAPHDILFTFDEYQKPSGPFATVLQPIKKVEALTKGETIEVKLHLSRFSASLINDLSSVKILSKGAVHRLGDEYAQKLFGTGPYVVKEITPQQIILESRDGHFQEPKSKRLVFKIIQDDATRYLKTLKGAIDIAQNEIPSQYIKEFESNGDFKVHKFMGLSMTYLLLNLKNPNLKNLKLRRTIAHALNRDEIIKFKLSGLATPATTIMTPAHPFFVKELAVPAFDLNKARELLKEAGLKEVALTLKTSNKNEVVEVARVIANQLAQVGIKINLQSFEWGTYYNDVKTGNFEMAQMKWVGTIDPDIYRQAFHAKELPPGRNRGSYLNPTLDPLLEQGLALTDFKKRYEHYKKIQTIVLQDLPIIPLWYDTQIAVTHNRVKDYTPPVNGDFTGLIKAWK